MKCNICDQEKITFNMHPVIFGATLPTGDPKGIPVCKDCYNDTIKDGFAQGQLLV